MSGTPLPSRKKRQNSRFSKVFGFGQPALPAWSLLRFGYYFQQAPPFPLRKHRLPTMPYPSPKSWRFAKKRWISGKSWMPAKFFNHSPDMVTDLPFWNPLSMLNTGNPEITGSGSRISVVIPGDSYIVTATFTKAPVTKMYLFGFPRKQH